MRAQRLMTVLAAAAVCAAAAQPSCRSGVDCASLAANRSAVLTVGPSGADCSSIQAAVNCAPAGARILIAPGVYREQVRVLASGLSLQNRI